MLDNPSCLWDLDCGQGRCSEVAHAQVPLERARVWHQPQVHQPLGQGEESKHRLDNSMMPAPPPPSLQGVVSLGIPLPIGSDTCRGCRCGRGCSRVQGQRSVPCTPKCETENLVPHAALSHPCLVYMPAFTPGRHFLNFSNNACTWQ